MSQVTPRGAVTPKMNITPLIDVVFLLIIFFMLVSKIVSDTTVAMIVPELEDPKVRELGEEVNRVVVNLVPQQFDRGDRLAAPLAFPGQPRFVQVGALQRFALGDVAGITAALTQARQARPEVEVVLRADGALYYEAVRPVMAAITAAGIEMVNLVAFLPQE